MTATHTTPRARPDTAPLAVLEAAIEPVLRGLGYELVLLQWDGGGRRTLRLFIDRLDEGAVTVDDCARVSHLVGQTVEATEVADSAVGALLRGTYHLEVSSPGIERPLVRRGHFDRFRGKRAKVRLRTPMDTGSNRRTFVGTVLGTEPEPGAPGDERQGLVLLRLDESEQGSDTGCTLRLPIRAIARAHLVYEG